MCFGNETTQKEVTKSVDPTLTSHANNNYDYLSGLRDQGYQEYTGPRVAELNGDQQGAAGMIRALAGSSDPYTSTISNAFTNAATAGPSQVSTSRVIDNVPGAAGGAAGTTADYMDPYLSSVLAPQLRDIDTQTIKNQNGLDARATMGGAFGDARSGIEAAENTRLGNLARTDTIGKGYSDAFNNAMALKSSDLARLLDVGKTNANLNETGMTRAIAGGNALEGLDKYDTGRQADLARLLSASGEQGRTIDQAKLDAAYGEYAKGQQYPLDISKLMIAANTPGAYSSTETTKGPDNSGYGMLGALGGTLLSAALAAPTGGLSLAALPALAGGAMTGSASGSAGVT